MINVAVPDAVPTASPEPGTPQTRHKARYGAAAAGFLVALFGTPMGDILFSPTAPLPDDYRTWITAVVKTLLALAVTYKLVEQVPNQPKTVTAK